MGEGRGRELLQLDEGEEGQVAISLFAFVNMKLTYLSTEKGYDKCLLTSIDCLKG